LWVVHGTTTTFQTDSLGDKTMTVTRSIFDKDKQYRYGQMHSLKELCHWDVNETSDELFQLLGEITRCQVGRQDLVIVDSGAKTFLELSAMPTTSDFNISDGQAFLYGRMVGWGDFEDEAVFTSYNEGAYNIIAKCKVSDIVEDDVDLYTITFHGSQEQSSILPHLTDAVTGSLPRIIFTSGELDGEVFEVVVAVGDPTTLTISGDLSLVEDNDTFHILPPAIAENVSTQADEVYLCHYYQEIDENLDNDLEDPLLEITPTHRFASRTFLTLNPDFADPDGFIEDATLSYGFVYKKVFDIARTTPGDVIVPVAYQHKYMKPAQEVHEDVSHIQEYMSYNDIQVHNLVIADRLTDDEINVSDCAVLYSDEVYEIAESTLTPDFDDNENYILAIDSEGVALETQASGDDESPSISVFQKIVYAARLITDPGDVILESMRMGEDIALVRGFDYVAGDYTATNSIIQVGPGEMFRFGRLYQLARRLTLDAQDTDNWLEGSVVEDGWAYLYVKPTANIDRSLNLFLSNKAPALDGSFRDVVALESAYNVHRAFCIGLVYVVEGECVISCDCRDGHIKFSNYDRGILGGTRHGIEMMGPVWSTPHFLGGSLPRGLCDAEFTFNSNEIGCSGGGKIIFGVRSSLLFGNGQVSRAFYVPSTAAPMNVTFSLSPVGALYAEFVGAELDWTIDGSSTVYLTAARFNRLAFTSAVGVWGSTTLAP
jgi:hypothetical protein